MVTLKQKNAFNSSLNVQIMNTRKQMLILNNIFEKVNAKLLSLHEEERRLQEIVTEDIELKKLKTKAIKALGTATTALQAMQRINSAMSKSFNKQLRLLQTKLLP